MPRERGKASGVRWLKGAWWTVALAVLLVATVRVVVSSATRAETVTAVPARSERNTVASAENGGSTLPDWDWEWQRDLDPALLGSPTHLR